MSATRNSFRIILFIACVVVPTLNNYELTFGVWSIAALVTLQKRYSLRILKLISTPVLILLIAFFSGLFNDYTPYDIIRDITYLLKPIIGLLLGYQLCRGMEGEKPARLIINTGYILAILHLAIAAFAVLFMHIRDMHELRLHAGYFNDFEMYALAMLIYCKRFNVEFPTRTRWLMILVMTISGFLYLARTDFILFGILIMALSGYLVLTKRALQAILVTMAIGIVGYAIIYNSNPRRGATGFEAFLYKVKIAPIEPFKTKINKDDWKDFNDNYRSFENIITVRQVSRSGTGSIIFGKGLGSHVDLGRKLWTNDLEFIRYLPALHNSYMTILLKSGLVGVFLLFVFIWMLFRQGKSENLQIRSINQLLIASAVFLILSNWVFMGLYFKVDTKSILIGFLIYHKETIKKALQVKA
ncbi:hypothetical protein HUK80_04470 [Flavobacterium sp. MAH-1]|uniref:O-antigen ligase n=1 Tax=Flavobacterium agri TaxID=2743471 RepID=A0A7Y8Y063_9FLAO|nr:hypothetical protein [Flavobacterium agri]NUY80139.1 hypothetical protein [Flavobacterium agri]NYA70164.1 hypothetical protein [Flavobacterium agri]